MTEVIIKRSSKANKKLDAIIDGKKTVSFGQKKTLLIILFIKMIIENRYINRHKDKEDWN